MRGTPCELVLLNTLSGIIPAHAGNTALSHVRPVWLRDHPRACGEHRSVFSDFPATQGSSPRMQGTLNSHPGKISSSRIIPAHAGNTRYQACTWRSTGDHPRACGEHKGLDERTATYEGSSPRMRGTRVVKFTEAVDLGIIPAHAGNTPPLLPRTSVRRDHPRACGEHLMPGPMVGSLLGSSPRMRGTQLRQHLVRMPAGIIPAHAGNTVKKTVTAAIYGDHPRACGEHILLQMRCVSLQGSSPRMRGTRRPRTPVWTIAGIIPAHAGNTTYLSHTCGRLRDHPRACGEHETVHVERVRVGGSSPRMRGTHDMERVR